MFSSRGVFSGAGRRRGLFDPPESYGTPGIGDGRNEDIQEPPAGLLSPDQPKPPGFWEGGDKFGWRDGLAGVLAAVGDAFAQRSGGQGGAVQGLTGGRLSAIDASKKAAKEHALMQAAERQGINPDQFALHRGGLGSALPKAPDEDVFIRRMRAAGIDPASPQGQAILQQKVAVDSSPNPSLIGDATSGWTWQTPPAPALPSAPQAQTQLNVGGEWLTPPKPGQQGGAPSIQDIQAERERRRQQRGY